MSMTLGFMLFAALPTAMYRVEYTIRKVRALPIGNLPYSEWKNVV